MDDGSCLFLGEEEGGAFRVFLDRVRLLVRFRFWFLLLPSPDDDDDDDDDE